MNLVEDKNFLHNSNRLARNGHMGILVKLSNLIVKNNNKEEVKAYLAEIDEDWMSYQNGELKRSNDTNNINLGG